MVSGTQGGEIALFISNKLGGLEFLLNSIAAHTVETIIAGCMQVPDLVPIPRKFCSNSLLKIGCSKTPLGHYALLVINKKSKVAFNNQKSIVSQGCFGTPHFLTVLTVDWWET